MWQGQIIVANLSRTTPALDYQGHKANEVIFTGRSGSDQMEGQRYGLIPEEVVTSSKENWQNQVELF
ncbi:hypothetical protein BK816_07005 [Boudabousia tangfeifanii]|uniref:Uncharacterized protein n=1 Tax=Boudabousia tangfeifanii TaxID=1912795 RepID=A0A1D9ML96_9ACTO|nr:hypothetical protein BK816_07005 [Boudabousia tangfeifanii]